MFSAQALYASTTRVCTGDIAGARRSRRKALVYPGSQFVHMSGILAASCVVFNCNVTECRAPLQLGGDLNQSCGVVYLVICSVTLRSETI